ncbi:MAG: hypothetical protein BWY83_01468 [bacterium ADurb.Bin478]|nr:MAG: hypothetical protein BWY83_01468 [bacterium ADurb.Bin478]
MVVMMQRKEMRMVLPNGSAGFPFYTGLLLMSALLLARADNGFSQQPSFGAAVDQGIIEAKQINEASGLAASRLFPGVLYTHNDSGDRGRVFAINDQGALLATIVLNGVTIRDCEDIAAGIGPKERTAYLYLADIGDNNAEHTVSRIHRFPEPELQLSDRGRVIVLDTVETIAFTYPDGPRDAETLLADPVTGDLFIVSKREESCRLYRLPFPQKSGTVLTAEAAGVLPLTMAVGGDISADGGEILIKNYMTVFYWHRDMQQPVAQALTALPAVIPYALEPQGEAIAWREDGAGFYTLSEEAFNIEAHLYYYPRLPSLYSSSPASQAVELTLGPNEPNPFDQATTVSFTVPETMEVELSVYNEQGQRVALLFQQTAVPGLYRVIWQAGAYSPGRYQCRLQTPLRTLTHSMTLARER